MHFLLHARGLLAVCFLVQVSACQQAQEAPDERRSVPDPVRFEKIIRSYEFGDQQNTVPRDAILFVGSSSIGGWPTAERFPGFPVINRGFGGSFISDVNYYAERIVLKYRPRAVVFYAGDNDIHGGMRPEQVFEDYQVFVGKVQEALPGTVLFFIPIKPSPSRWHLWPQMKDANERIRASSEADPHLFYVDTATPMLGADGTPKPELFLEDGLHMNAAGYTLWTSILQPYLEQIMRRDEE